MYVPADDEYTEGIVRCVDAYVFDKFQNGYNFLQGLKKNHVRVTFADKESIEKFQEMYLADDDFSNRITDYCVFDNWLFKFKGAWYAVRYTRDINVLDVVVLDSLVDSINYSMNLSIKLDSKTWDFVTLQDLFCGKYKELFEQKRPLKMRSMDKKLVEGWKTAADMQEYHRKDFKRASMYINGVMCILGYINHQIEQQREWEQMLREEKQAQKEAEESTETAENKPLEEKPSNSANTEKKSYKRGVITIGGLKLNVPKGSGITKSRVMHRHAEVWGVRGHYRHYKNGKVVFIEPYKKGKKRNELEPTNRKYLVR